MGKHRKKNDKEKPATAGEKPLENKKHEFFCQLYAGIATKNFFGNATQSYLQAFGGQEEINDIEERMLTMDQEKDFEEIMKSQGRITTIKNVARSQAHVLLTKPDIHARCAYLTNRFLDPEKADQEMAWTIAQREHIPSKVTAYTAVARVKNRISDKLQGEFIFRWEDDEDEEK